MIPDVRVLRAALQSPHIDGGQVTFFWKGTRPPQLMGDFTEWERGRPVDMVSAGRSLWVYQVDLPLDTYMEYSYRDGDIRIAASTKPQSDPGWFWK